MKSKTFKPNEPFLNIEGQDLFLFLGSPLSEFSFEHLQGARTFVEHFEEYIRWEKAKETEWLREKYVLTNTHPQQTLSELNAHFTKEVARYQPSVVTVVLSEKDVEEQTTEQLFQLLKQVLQLKNNQAKCILLTPWTPRDEKEKQWVKHYIETLKKRLSTLKDNDRHRVFMVDGKRLTDLSEHLNTQHELNARGHLEMAKGFIQDLYGPEDDCFWEQMTLDLIFKKEKIVEELTIQTPARSLSERLSSKEPLTWLFMGDSITHGALWTFGYKDYVECFTQYIKNTFDRKKDIFINTAVSGATIPSTLDRIETRLNPYQPDIIYLKLGANDVVYFTAAEYKENLKIILGHLKAKEALIILSTPTPSDIGDREAKRMKEYIAVLKEIAQEYSGILFIDQYSTLNTYLNDHPAVWKKDYTFYTDEVLHLGANGQLYMFHNLVKQLGIIKEDSPLLNYFFVSKDEDALIVKDVFHTLYQ